ncbi:MAG: redoxin domain-containing protein [Phycisphaerae bacterium]
MKLPLRLVGVAFSALLAASAFGQKIGKPAPDFTGPNPFNADKEVKLANYKGRILLLWFFRSGDSGSVASIKTLVEINKNYGKNGVVVVGFTPEEREKVESFIKGREIPFVVFSGGTLHRLYEVAALPQVVIIDPESVVAWRGHPGDELEERVKRQIARTPPVGSDAKALKDRLARAQQALEKGDAARAYALVKSIIDIAEVTGQSVDQAKSVQNKAEEAAKKLLEKMKEDAKGGDKSAASIAKLADISVRMPGTDAAREADEELGRMRGDIRTKNLVRTAIDDSRGAMRNDDAAELESLQRYTEALDTYKDVTDKYADTPAGKTAQAAIERINTDPKIQGTIRAKRAEEEADRWLDLGDRYATCGLADLARKQYDKLLEAHPKTAAAANAKKRIEALPKES